MAEDFPGGVAWTAAGGKKTRCGRPWPEKMRWHEAAHGPFEHPWEDEEKASWSTGVLWSTRSHETGCRWPTSVRAAAWRGDCGKRRWRFGPPAPEPRPVFADCPVDADLAAAEAGAGGRGGRARAGPAADRAAGRRRDHRRAACSATTTSRRAASTGRCAAAAATTGRRRRTTSSRRAASAATPAAPATAAGAASSEHPAGRGRPPPDRSGAARIGLRGAHGSLLSKEVEGLPTVPSERQCDVYYDDDDAKPFVRVAPIEAGSGLQECAVRCAQLFIARYR